MTMNGDEHPQGSMALSYKGFGVKSMGIQGLKMLDPGPVQPSLWISSSDVILVTVLSASSQPIPKYQLDHFSLGGLLVACLSKICRATFRCCWLQIATMDYFGLYMDCGLPKEKDILLSVEYGLRTDFVTSRNLKRQPKLLSKHQGSQSFTKFRLVINHQLFVKFIGPPGFQYVSLLDEGPARLKLVKPSSC